MYATFRYTHWLILRCTRQPLDHCENSIGRTLGLEDVFYFSGELVKFVSYKYPLPPYIFLIQTASRLCKNLSFVSVCCEFAELTVRRFLKFCFKEITTLNLVNIYVMLLKCCHVLLVVVLSLVVL
jgi:hypothetical protein